MAASSDPVRAHRAVSDVREQEGHGGAFKGVGDPALERSALDQPSGGDPPDTNDVVEEEVGVAPGRLQRVRQIHADLGRRVGAVVVEGGIRGVAWQRRRSNRKILALTRKRTRGSPRGPPRGGQELCAPRTRQSDSTSPFGPPTPAPGAGISGRGSGRSAARFPANRGPGSAPRGLDSYALLPGNSVDTNTRGGLHP